MMENTENIYVIGTETGSEPIRLVVQDQLVTKAMGGIFSKRYTPQPNASILDLACGPGGWSIEVAFQLPNAEVIGVDLSKTMIGYARSQADVQQLSNISFEVMDIKRPLDFPDESFDLINARFLLALMAPADWPRLWHECFRLLRPGGVLRWTEGDIPQTTSAATQKFYRLLAEGLYKANQSCSIDGYSIGIIPVMAKFLAEARYQDIQQEPHVINTSARAALHESAKSDTTLLVSLIQPFLLKQRVASQEELNLLSQEILADWSDNTQFYSISFLLTVLGTKPYPEKYAASSSAIC